MGSATIVSVLISVKVSIEVSVSVCTRLFHEVTVEVFVTVEMVVRAGFCDVIDTVVVVLLVGQVVALLSMPKKPCGGVVVNKLVVNSSGKGLFGTIKAGVKEGTVASRTTRKERTNIAVQ